MIERKIKSAVLLSEDNTDNAGIIIQNLFDNGINAYYVRTVTEAKDTLFNHGANISDVISDLDLKGSSGPFARLDGYFFF